ncbi:hypothetical protein HOLleu_37617 [Holothuria leucospilota]|uniref:Uncharacterized protein n=1 Tax=Holothuria leucospilota TaxID=206669 RepID=A0A9Q1BEW4_HOLLE|nr:hypothetical protein HOLleu_37617 [Holothuria leucospilota]
MVFVLTKLRDSRKTFQMATESYQTQYLPNLVRAKPQIPCHCKNKLIDPTS